MTLNEYLKAASQHSAHVQSCIATLAQAYPDLAQALQTDPNVKKADWAALCDALCKVASADPKGVQDAVRAWGRAPGRDLSGPPARLRGVAKLASCTTLRRLAGVLSPADPNMLGIDDWERLLAELARGGSLKAQRRRLGPMDLGRFAIWATFDPSNPNGDPAGHLPRTGDNIAACLGLPRDQDRRSLCILRYKLPEARSARLPTVATAAAAGRWNPLWRPARRNAAFGMTHPWLDWPDPIAAPAGRAKPYGVPEAVHEPVTGADLSDTIELR